MLRMEREIIGHMQLTTWSPYFFYGLLFDTVKR
jgi:hypothetical protein